MNKKILISLFVILIIVAGLYFVSTNIPAKQTPVINGSLTASPEEITATSASYISEKGQEAVVSYYSNKTASLDLIGTQYKNVMFNIAISASGARYENKELGLVLWEKAPNLSITNGDQLIFSGKLTSAVIEEENIKFLTSNKLIWSKTFNGTGPHADEGGVITPKKVGTFTLSFTKDGKVSGKTDCNSFSGEYTLNVSKITFGPLASTLMTCENSQESEFLKMLTNSTTSEVSVSTSTNTLILENNVTMYFVK